MQDRSELRPSAVIVGFELNGLGIARALARRGVSCLAVASDRKNAYSGCAHRVRCRRECHEVRAIVPQRLRICSPRERTVLDEVCGFIAQARQESFGVLNQLRRHGGGTRRVMTGDVPPGGSIRNIHVEASGMARTLDKALGFSQSYRHTPRGASW